MMKFFTNSDLLPLIAILVVVALWFSPWWIGGRVLAPLDLQNRMMSPWRGTNETEFAKNHIVSDCVDQYLVYRLIAERDYGREGRVGWSSLTYGGTAQHANTMALYYDWTMQLHRWLGFWTAWHLGIMGQLALAGSGMFLFLRGRKIHSTWALCGALAYTANSQFVTWIYHRWSLGSFCWVPWILWSIDLYRSDKRRAWPLVPVFICMAFLGGTLQHAAIVVLAVLAMWIDEALFLHSSRGTCGEKRDGGVAQAALLGRYTAWGLLGTGLAAMMIIPCVDAFIPSHRLGIHTGMTVNAAHSVYPHGPLQPLFNLAAYPLQIFPSLLGSAQSVDLLKLFKSELFYVVYFGSLPVSIAYLAFWRRDTPALARILTGFGLLLPLTPLVRLLYQRLFLLFVLGGIFGFAHFMQHASRQTRLLLFRIATILFGAGVVLWSMASIVWTAKTDLAEGIRDKIASGGHGSSFGYFREWIALRADRFVSELPIWSMHQFVPLMLLAMGLAGLRASAAQTKAMRSWGAMLVLAAVFCELSLFASRWVVWSDPVQDPMFAETAESRVLKHEVGRDGRVSTLNHPDAHMARTPFIPNTLAVFGIASITGYDSIVPDGMVLPNESPGNSMKLGLLGVSHLITWHGNPDVPAGWTLQWSSPSMNLYQNENAVPRYAGFASYPFDGGVRIVNPDKLVPLRERGGLENTRLLEVPEGVEWIRIAENQADGWQYRVKSDQAGWRPVERAPDATMLLRNPMSGQVAEIEMRYDPPAARLGLWVSLCSLAILTTASFCLRYRSYGDPGSPLDST